ncbi:MAG: cupin domain-containing protein [Candidatus Caldarchaeum sp.]
MTRLSKPAKEFFDTDSIVWEPVEQMPGAFQKILSRDSNTGSYTRLVKFLPGFENYDVLVHDFWEEVYIIKGYIIDKTLKKTFNEGMYACRPPGMKHGPYSSPAGALLIEFRYYET